MTWKFHVLASTRPRLFSRILQVLDSQRVNIDSFSGDTDCDRTSITVVFSSEQDRAYRIETLLYRLEDVREVSILSGP